MTLSAEARVAASAVIAEAVLPRDALPIEKAVLAAEIAAFLAVDPSVISTIWSPWRCPAALLPYLAWAVSVDVWDHNWPEDVKRDVIAASPTVHRLKGTRGAVETALKALRASVKITEWWEAEPVGRRGTFELTAYVRGRIGDAYEVLSAQRQKQIGDAVKASKPKSRVYTLKLAAAFDDGLQTANTVAALEVTSRVAVAKPLTDTKSQMQAANTVAALQVAKRTATARPMTDTASRLVAANSLACMQVVRATMNAR